jgi:hypothetical protein
MTLITQRRVLKGAVCAAFIGFALAPAPVLAQESAAPSVDREREESGVIQRYRDRYRSLKDKGVALTLGSILPGSSLSAGVELERERLFGTFIGASFDAAWSVRGYHQYDVRLGRLKGRDHRTELGPADADITSVFNDNSLLAFGTSVFVEWRQRVYPRVDFFGLGQQSRVDARTDYGISGSSLDLVLQWQRDAHFGLSGRAGTMDLHLEPGTNHSVTNTDDVFLPEAAPGLDRQPRYVTVGGAATLDYRDRPRLTTTGTFVSVGVWHAAPASDADASAAWTRLIAEVRGFHPLHGEKHVLALHGFVSTRLGDAATPTPFYLQPTLGGSKTLRGFGSYRLRGDALWTATAEYRWRAHRWIEIAPFVDVGAVAGSWGALSGVRPSVTPGIGLRALSSTRVIGRADVAHGRDGTRMVLTLSTPF